MTAASRHFVLQLRDLLVQSAAISRRAEADARDAARTAATESEKKEDARAALEFGSLATGHQGRARAAEQQIEVLDALLAKGLPEYTSQSPVGMGAIIDVATEDERGSLERTFIMLPVGAGTELAGPGGDGFITVVTPASPVGRALMGRRAGDVTDVVIKGEPYEWEVTAVG